MKLKKYKIMILAVVCFLITSVQAQQKHEFSVYGGGGLSTLNYNINTSNDDKVHPKTGIVAGVGYTLFLKPQWGVSTGIELTTYRSESEIFSIINTHQVVDNYGDNFDFRVFLKEHTEKQEAKYLNIPIMVQFQSHEGTGFYARLGGKIGLPIKGQFKYSYNQMISSGYYPAQNVLYDDLEYRGFGKFGSDNGGGNLDLRVAFMLSAETGMKWSLNESFSLYTGIYADYGLNNIVKGAKTEKILPYNNENPLDFNCNSILTNEYTQYENTKPLVGNVAPLAVGLKLRLAFSAQ